MARKAVSENNGESHAESTGKKAAVEKKSISRIDYAAFGKKVCDWLNDNAHDTRYLASRVELSEPPYARERIMESIASGYKTTPEDVQAVAEFCGIEIPYTDKALEKKSPFGGGRGRGGAKGTEKPSE